MLEKDMENLLAEYPSDFFPRFDLALEGRQRSFRGVGRFDLLFHDQHGFSILMELKAVTARYENADQLARYWDAMKALGESKVIMWLVSPSIPASVRMFLDQLGIQYTEIHVAEFKQVALLRGYQFTQRDEIASPDLFDTSDHDMRQRRAREMHRRVANGTTHTRASVQEDPRLATMKNLVGTVGGQSKEQMQRMKVLSVFKDYIHRPFDATMRKYMVNEAMKQDRVIQWSYLCKRLLNQPLFAKDRIGAALALRWIVQLLIAEETIVELTASQVLSQYKYTGKAYSLRDLEKIEGD